MESIVLGLNAYHADSAACIVKSGKLIAAAEEERFRRIKHWAGFPSQSIAYCLDALSIKLSDVTHIAINSDPKANVTKKLKFTLRNRPELALILDRLKNKIERHSIEENLAIAFPNDSFRGSVHKIEHHLAHLASAYYCSPFSKAVCVSVDGFGDFASCAWGLGSNQSIALDQRIYFPHSMGIFYQALTQYLGFPNYGDEYKIMGLAPYGQPKYIEHMRDIVSLCDHGEFALNLKYFRHHKEKINYQWADGSPEVGSLYSDSLISLLGEPRRKDEPLEQYHKDLASSIQARYEEVFFHLLTHLHEHYASDNLAIAGGCGMNSVANGKVTRFTRFKQVYIQSAAGDAGGAVGAALELSGQLGDKKSLINGMPHAYWGPEFDDRYIGQILESHRAKLEQEACVVTHYSGELDQLVERTASYISQAKVIGWFQGRMEWGPRSLGNRSILCDPCNPAMKDILNLKIKRRESFRPFAPSILREQVSEWFEQDDSVPFMMKVFQVREEKRARIPAVTHVDGSGRLQTVEKQANALYWSLIDRFYVKTGVPILLNTSFNENEPVVCRPEEALDCFLRTQMDVLVMGSYMVVRQLT